ncbi:uncharacterized protein LOC8278783 [Ricinus communis]|uniref:J domain-containing protein n=1 Tax=Ricinus communis TaxID=3988 RepID=B9RTB0_RICCO|nr:uncharacterized protein LOC8278783 [Ricinus communis]EEF45593.1 conserved hypothetical protein [Ricinus communis]|eukprot:XP_002516979.1 uncharacterized protein LOC8278783 [Ricinus communis]
MGKESDTTKSQLVLEICSLSNLSNSCSHKHSLKPVKSHFIDWYRILGIKEDADVDVIRKRYHKLALQLHPDKNKHPKAEIAFKLVLEAYSCLSDNVKRRAFNLERWKNFCTECNDVHCNSRSKLQDLNPANHSRSYRILQGLKDIRQRFREEAKVMENCLKANATLRNESPIFNPTDHLYQSNTRCRSRRESPIFDPSDYLFEGYPHVRNRVYKKPDDVWFSQKQNSSNYAKGTARYDCPIFENRSDRGMLKTKSACVSS